MSLFNRERPQIPQSEHESSVELPESYKQAHEDLEFLLSSLKEVGIEMAKDSRNEALQETLERIGKKGRKFNGRLIAEGGIREFEEQIKKLKTYFVEE